MAKTAPQRVFTFQPPADVHSLTSEHLPPGHLRSLFSLPHHHGNVSEVGPGEYPDSATFFSVYAPTTDAQSRGPSCRDAKAQGKASESWRWRVCGDPGWGTPLVLRQYANVTSPRAFERFMSDTSMRAAYIRRENLADLAPPPRLRAVELGSRRETRRLQTLEMPFSTFLNKYRTPQRPAGDAGSAGGRSSAPTEESIYYAVSPLPHQLAADVNLPSVLRCGGGARALHQLNLWMSAGGTESVLHTDQYDNMNCVFAGTKRFFLIDSQYYGLVADPRCGWYDANAAVKAAGDEAMPEAARRLKHGYGAFGGGVNVSAVDLRRFPCFANLPFVEATLHPGDCLFLPRHWVHHVASDGGTHDRSVALNLWWVRPERYEPTDCVTADRDRSGARIYADEEPVPIADCAMRIWADADAGNQHQPPCRHGRREFVAEPKMEL